MTNQDECYWAFMVRLYRIGDSEPFAWRVSLEDPHTGTRFGFATIEALFDFLRARTQNRRSPEIPPPVREKSEQLEREP